MSKETILFRFVPTMRCNFRCEYCFIENHVKQNGNTMFDTYSVDQWIEAIKHYSQYNIELYFWGGEPFCIPGTYQLLNAWTKMDSVIPGIRIDTNVFFAEKIAAQCPSNKIKLNCSYHMQYHTLEEEFKKVKLLKDLDMVAMVNFVASKYNLMHLKNEYGMTVKDLIEKFAEIDVFVNIAGDFAYTNDPSYERYEEYREFILQFISPEEWKWLRGVDKARKCTAGQKMFTVQYNGDFTSCISDRIYGNFFEGKLEPDKEPEMCDKNCPSIISYPFRCDNDYPTINSLLEYIKRNQTYRGKNKKPYQDFEF